MSAAQLAAAEVLAEQEPVEETVAPADLETVVAVVVEAAARVVILDPAVQAGPEMVALTAMRAIAVLEAVAAVDAEVAPLLSLEALAAAPPLVVKERQAQEPLQPQGFLVAAVLEA
jgi:hypothetical protein